MKLQIRITRAQTTVRTVIATDLESAMEKLQVEFDKPYVKWTPFLGQPIDRLKR